MVSAEVLPPDENVPGINVYVEHMPLPGGARFETHAHWEHQVVWTASGSILVAVGERTWALPPTLALWVPAGVEHTTWAPRATAMRGVFVHPQIPSPWPEPTIVAVTALARELLELLSDVELLGPTRERAESLLLDLLRPVSVRAISLPMPADRRALEVARYLEEHPFESLGLEGWGRKVGASGRTLSRLFVDETGLTFSQWRTSVRMRVALARLAAGDSITAIAFDAGYSAPSAFIAAFRRATGETPGRYFRQPTPH
jgi:AraC-like DNA-binding protein/quercetin dioxygenase-like cupin family protein